MRGYFIIGTAMMLAPSFVVPAYAQEMQPGRDDSLAGFDPYADDFDSLYTLQKQAEEKANDKQFAAENPLEVRQSWTDLKQAAQSAQIAENVPHPLAALADIKIASIDYELGDIEAAQNGAAAGLAALKPFKQHYFATYIEGVSLLSLLYSQTGSPQRAADMLAPAVREFAAYFDRLDDSEKTRAVIVSKSNMEFAYSQTLTRLGDSEQALIFQKMSLDTREAGLGKTDPDTIASYYSYAQVLLRTGQAVEAERYARMAVELATAHISMSHPSYARSLEMLGIVLSRTGRRIEGVEYLDRALQIKEETVGPDNLYFAYGVHNLGTILLQLERYAEAEALLLKADSGFRANQGEASPFAAGSLASAGQASYARSNFADADTRLTLALKRIGESGSNDAQIKHKIYPELILSKLRAGDSESARGLAADYLMRVRQDEAAEPFEFRYASALQQYAMIGEARSEAIAAAKELLLAIENSQSLSDAGEMSQPHRSALDLVLNISAETGDADIALHAMVILAGSKIAQSNRLLTDRLADNDPVLAERIRIFQDQLKQVKADDSSLLLALANDEDVAPAQDKLAQSRSELETLRKALSEDFPQWSEAGATQRPALDEVQAGLADDQAILGVIPAYEGVFAILITRSGAQVRKLASGREQVSNLLAGIRRSLQSGNFDEAASSRLYEEIFTGDSKMLLKDVKSLKIVATGPFSSLPFALLLNRSDDSADADSWLFENYALSVQPGFSVSKQHAMPLKSGKLLGIGSPLPFGAPDTQQAEIAPASAYFRGGGIDLDALSDLPPLTSSSAELNRIAEIFGPGNSSILTGSDASESRLQQMDLTDYRTIVFATHGLVGGEMDGVTEPALVLSPEKEGGAFDGLLTSSDIARLRLNADWVVLSACNTAAGEDLSAPGYSGLAQAFNYAGARSLLVSHWPVRDDVAAYLTTRTIENAENGMAKDMAFQKAMIDLYRSDDIPGARHPYLWAPFVLVGN